MHVRFSTCIGTPVIDDGTEEVLGMIGYPFIHPDLGVLEGFFVDIPRFLHTERLFLAVTDILHWGTHVRITDADVLAPLSERMRLQAFYDEGRTVMGQRMLTESGALLGVCKDIQFDTKTFVLEWLFPRKLFRWGIAVPASAIIEVKSEAVMLRDLAIPREIEEKPPILTQLEELAKVPTAGMYRD